MWLSAIVCCCFTDGRVSDFGDLGGEIFGRTDVKERADAVSSVVALIGVGGSILGVKFHYPLVGLVISGLILKAGLETGYQSVLELVDAAIPVENLMPIRETILKVEGVKEACRSLCKFQFSFRVLSEDDIVAGSFTGSLTRNLIVGVLALIFGSFVG
ncbi:hypothetical protein KPL71_026315 [Citrus sinensis]|uniref:Uncharacterized protein n=1 Tax=Citrus sinensis TaxID=2711 RepID=A0ACB8HYM7_CITSI|nr:hypothetical protein KPL71_026315 [Citrus sinensis]